MYALYSENIPREPGLSPHHASPRQSSPSPDLTLLFSLTLFITLVMSLAVYSLPKHTLENHPMCGTTTGGKDECYFDCKSVPCVNDFDILVQDLACLQDCFENEPDNCVTSLLNDVIDNGVCEGVIELDIYPLNNTCEFAPNKTLPSKGTCSDKTETLLVTDECLKIIFEQQEFIINTLTSLIYSSCRESVSVFYFNFTAENNIVARSASSRHTRLAPVHFILQDPDIKTQLEYKNTRNRYPWVCSLRSTGPSPAHRCAVNLLAIPPSPTVLVGAAHCTYLCKDGSREVPVCCCSFDTDDCRATDPRCGEKPEVFEMSAEDSVVVCGEWDTSQAMSLSSGERYNVRLPILEIVRHPDFDPEKGPINGKDIVVFKVDDSKLQNNIAETLELWPACLPSQTSEVPKSGFHSGWSQPPSFSFIQNQAQGFSAFYNDFYKQWHYKMTILNKCEDPKESGICGATLDYPSNSAYPAGTVCAKDFSRQSCFSTGDSGSPLMAKYQPELSKYHIEGVLSFVKGCDEFQFGGKSEVSNKTTYFLTQRSENPTTYTKLSCFLPWVAAQYNMKYETTNSYDPACLTGSGDPNDGKNTCRSTPSNWADLREDLELECKFPFYYDNKRYDECILFNEDDFLYPVFRCPVRDITTKINGINSFSSSVFSSSLEGICLSDISDEELPLDPDIDCYYLDKRPPFSQCKNNCPGVRAFGIIGGGAVVAGVGTLGLLSSFTPVLGVGALGAVGAVGIGGMMVAESTCSPPFFCRLPSGRCCRVVNVGVSGPRCPDTC